MLFSSITFLYFFLPLMALYFLLPHKWKNWFLLIASLVFYFFGEPIYILLLLASSVSDWVHSLYMERHRGERAAKRALISSIVINLLMLGFFKYADFLIGSCNTIFGLSIPLLHIPLPIGISFFTFQTMSYSIDVYRGEVKAQRNLSAFATYVCLFPQLIAGPIVRYTDVAKELEERKSSIPDVTMGILRFCVGLGKKVLIANLLGEVCADFMQASEKTVLFHWMYAVAFSLQIYFDFSGYSDMAIGLGKLFGFSFPENFSYPFISRSITEFWRRWHITLGSWFRDYVYIPLGGNRCSKGKWVRNIAIVWCLTGLWHGAQWNFVVWGLFFGVLLALEKLWLGSLLEKLPVFVRYGYTVFMILISFVIFNAQGLAGVVTDLSGMFGGGDLGFANQETLYTLRNYLVIYVVALLGATPLPKQLWNQLPKAWDAVLSPVGAAGILLLATACLINGSFNPFLYFRF